VTADAGAIVSGTKPSCNGNEPEALEPKSDAAARAEGFLWTARSFPEAAEYHYYAGLAHAAAHDAAAAGQQAGHLQALATHHRQLAAWARSCPENFETRAALVGAELARLRGDREEAARLYEELVRAHQATLGEALPDLYHRLGLAERELSNHESAVAWFGKALEQHPGHRPSREAFAAL